MYLKYLLIILLLIPSVSAFDISIEGNNLIINGEFNEIKVYHEYEANGGYKTDLVRVIDFDGSYSYSLINLGLDLDESYYFLVCSSNEEEGCRVVNFGYREEGAVTGSGLHQVCDKDEDCSTGNCVNMHCCPIDRECYLNNKCYDVGEFTSDKKYVCTNTEDIGDFKTCDKYCSEQGKRCVNGGCVLAKIASVVKTADLNEYPAIAGTSSSCVDSDFGKNYLQSGNIKLVYTQGMTQTMPDYCVSGKTGVVREYFCDRTQGKYTEYDCDNGCVSGKCLYGPNDLKIISTEGKLFTCPNYGPGIRIDWGAIQGADHYRVEYKVNGEWKGYSGNRKENWINFIQLPDVKKCYVDNQICNRCLDSKEVYEIRIKAQDANNNDLTGWSVISRSLGDIGNIISFEEYENIVNAIESCDIDYLKTILDDSIKKNALKEYCLNPICDHENCNYNNITTKQLALLNIKPERLVNVRITADDAFILYLNGVEKLRGNKWDKLYEKDIRMSDGDIILIWAWDKGGSKWLVVEAFDKETGELIFNSKAANPHIGNPAEWVTYPDYAVWTVADYTIQLNMFYNENNFKYKEAYIPWKTTYDTKTGSFDESYNNLYKSTEFSKVKSQLKDNNTQFVWGGYYKTRESLPNNPTSMSKFFIGRKINFPEDLK